jgi:hypothetical protein
VESAKTSHPHPLSLPGWHGRDKCDRTNRYHV